MPAKSKAQQRFMGMVHAYKKGELKGSEVSKAIKKESSIGGVVGIPALGDFVKGK